MCFGLECGCGLDLRLTSSRVVSIPVRVQYSIRNWYPAKYDLTCNFKFRLFYSSRSQVLSKLVCLVMTSSQVIEVRSQTRIYRDFYDTNIEDLLQCFPFVDPMITPFIKSHKNMATWRSIQHHTLQSMITNSNNKREKTPQNTSGEPIKSIMKVRTLHESLNSIRKNIMGRWSLSRSMTNKKDDEEEDLKNSLSDTTHSTCSSTCSSTSSEPKKRTRALVTFQDVEVREYELVPGLNPSITDLGPPVELGWKSTEAVIYSLDQFEKVRCDFRCDRNLLRMPACVRKDLLLIHRNDRDSIRRATEEAYRTNRQRAETAALERLRKRQEDESRNKLSSILPSYSKYKF